MRPTRNIFVEGPIDWRKDAARGVARAFEQMTNDRIAVDGKGEGLAHFALFKNRVGEVDADVLKRRALMGGDGRTGVLSSQGSMSGSI